MAEYKPFGLREKSMKSTIRIELRKDKPDRKGLAPIRIIYQVKGRRRYIVTRFKVHPDNWDIRGQRVVYKEEGQLTVYEVRNTNNQIDDLVRSIKILERSLEVNGVYSAELVANLKKKSQKSRIYG